jgi:hypothetical protein
MDKSELERWLARAMGYDGQSVAPLSVSPSLALTRGLGGRVRITDRGQTLARAPRLASIVLRRDDMSARLFRGVLAHHRLAEAHGTIYLEVPGDRVGGGVFRFLEALARVRELLGLPAI